MTASCKFCSLRSGCPVYLDLLIETSDETELDKAAFFQGNNCDSFTPTPAANAKSKKHR